MEVMTIQYWVILWDVPLSRSVFLNLFLLAAHHEVSMTQHGTPKC
jgi:hypothetical protein